MGALKSNLVNTETRNKLQDVLPLKTPYTIAIDPCNLCNFKCKFCAMQSANRKVAYKKQSMSLELFCKLIDDIAGFPDKLKILRISGQGEPLLNKNICQMIAYAKSKNVAESIEIVTNGSMLKPKLNQELVESGIDRIRISIEAIDEQGYKDMAEYKIDMVQFLEQIKDLHKRSGESCEICVKTVDAAVVGKEDEFYHMFENICDRMFIDNVAPLWSDFEELNEAFELSSQKGMHGQQVKKITVCPFPLYSFIINSEGEVTACCADWERKLVLGNADRESVVDIWNGAAYTAFKKDLLYGKKHTYQMCQTCELPNFNCSDNIDEFAEEVVKRY